MTQLSNLLLIRHGERADQVPGHPWKLNRIPRRYDPPLTSNGLVLAADTGKGLRHSNGSFRVVYSSPLTRCLQTAAEIAHQLSLPVIVNVSLAKPCHYFRKCERLGKAPQYADEKEAAKILSNVHSDVTLLEFQEDNGKTCVDALELLIEKESCGSNEGNVTLVVGHCESQKELFDLSGFTFPLQVPYCGVAHFNYSRVNGDGNWQLNRTPAASDQHLLQPFKA